jgi:hypothetical protein
MILKRNWEKNFGRIVYDRFDDVPVEENPNKHYKEIPNELLFTGDSLFTKKFFKELSFILGSDEGRNFKKKK